MEEKIHDEITEKLTMEERHTMQITVSFKQTKNNNYNQI